MKKIIIFADSKVGFDIVNYLISNHSNDIQKVITIQKNDVEDLCKYNDIPYLRFESEEKLIPFLQKTQIDLGILAWGPKIISKKLISLPEDGFINLHNSFLPFNRGKHPYFWTFIENCPYGVTIHKVDEGIDTGEIFKGNCFSF